MRNGSYANEPASGYESPSNTSSFRSVMSSRLSSFLLVCNSISGGVNKCHVHLSASDRVKDHLHRVTRKPRLYLDQSSLFVADPWNWCGFMSGSTRSLIGSGSR